MGQNKLYPREIGIEKGDKHKKVTAMIEDCSSPFYKKTMKQVFMYALGIGYANKKRTTLTNRAGTIPFSTFDDDDLAIIKSISIADNSDVDVMFGENVKDMIKTAEEYANTGIELLYYQIFGPDPGDPDKKLEQILRDILNENESV